VIGAIVVVALALVAMVWIAAPLLRGRRADTATSWLDVQEAEARKHAALSALVDIEEDLEIGKLSTADFDVLRAEYEREAMRALKDLDASAAGDSLEDEIAAMRRKMLCPNCGALRVPGEACTKCDAPA
jgi:cytochrome c-type biogenesis protein CcmI